MDVYLVPVGSARYELYCETPDDDDDLTADEPSDRGPFRGVYARFREMLAEARETRRARRLEAVPSDPEVRQPWLVGLRNWVVSWVAETVAEQRLLWHLRKQSEAALHYPDDLSEHQAREVGMTTLVRDTDRHRRWFILDGIIAAILGPLLFFVPGPNLVAYYFTFRAVAHFLSWRGARHGLHAVTWRAWSSAPLAELRRTLTTRARAARRACARGGRASRARAPGGVRRADGRRCSLDVAPHWKDPECLMRDLCPGLSGWLVVVLGLALPPAFAEAQTSGGPRGEVTTTRATGALTRFQATLGGMWLPVVDEQFNWDFDIAADFDIADLGFLRASIFYNLETITGTEFRNVDPNQSNYTLDTSVSTRLPRGEIAFTLHHVSRHLSDRTNRRGTSWNMLGVSYGDRFTVGEVDLRPSVRYLKTIKRSQVDYEGELAGYLAVAAPMSPRVALYSKLTAVFVPVDPAEFDRTDRTGGLVEGGVRVVFNAAAVEGYAAWERRIDADPVLRVTEEWPALGFRVIASFP